MSRNVPDDWGSYYRNCTICGEKYHLSEGGCYCTEDLDCQCGEGWWEKDLDGVISCSSCKTEPWVETSRVITFHKARKDHKHGNVRAGDHYARRVLYGYFPGGKSTRDIYCWTVDKQAD